MKIISLAICVDNNDPKALGRIRCEPIDESISGIENITEYEPWSENDSFIALPFLPNNINFIPEKNQTVKIIRYNEEKTTVNQEYIAGPFTTRYDFNLQTFSQQIGPTTYGTSVKKKSDLITNDKGELPPDCKDTLHRYQDYAIDGKYGSDLVFTEGGIVLRGGKLLAKESKQNINRIFRIIVEYILNHVS